MPLAIEPSQLRKTIGPQCIICQTQAGPERCVLLKWRDFIDCPAAKAAASGRGLVPADFTEIVA